MEPLSKDRFLDILKNFVIFEKSKGKTIKKLPRYQQLRATNRTVSKLKEKDEGGVIWHTQGSGKSITMSYIARKLQAEENGFENPTTLILTDRIDLDSQISDLFVNTGFQNVHKVRAAKHLQGLLNNSYGGIITTTVQRFMEREEPQENTEITRKKNSEGQIVQTIKFFNEEQKIHS